ncbi:MAG: glycosyltransferase family 4 protein [Acidobacteria bacterium]|nr:glycosyltransferase family 4 protein [Acidobacteriota bacterium]
MRIAIDARELHGRPTGVGRYLREILAAWKTLPAAAAHEVILMSPQGATGGTLWEQLVLPRLVRSARADVLFAPGYTGPLRCPVPMVVTIHDVSFAAHPEWFRWREGLRRRVLTRLAARRASRVLTVSRFSKQEIVTHLGIDEDKIEVIYSGVTRLADVTGAPSVSNETSRDPVVLYVGSLFTRRHVPELIEGFARLARRRGGARLEIVGDNRTTPHIDVDRVIRATGLAGRIRVRPYAPDEELAALYGRASAFVFLSEYEGFGFTPLEALSAAVPIVVLDSPAAREMYAAAAVYVERPDPMLVERALGRLLDDEAERQRVLAAAARVLARYSWHECAARVLDVLVTCGADLHGPRADRKGPPHV